MKMVNLSLLSNNDFIEIFVEEVERRKLTCLIAIERDPENKEEQENPACTIGLYGGINPISNLTMNFISGLDEDAVQVIVSSIIAYAMHHYGETFNKVILETINNESV